MIEVLVVDDDPRVARINAAYTDRVPGFRTAGTAHTTGEAPAWLAGHHADLLLLDLRHLLHHAGSGQHAGETAAAKTMPTTLRALSAWAATRSRCCFLCGKPTVRARAAPNMKMTGIGSS